MAKRQKIAKRVESALPGQVRLFPGERLLDMPLAKNRAAEGLFIFRKGEAFLQLDNLEESIVWKLDLVRKDAPADVLADSFTPYGGRNTNALADGVDAEPAPDMPDLGEAADAATIDGITEFGLQAPDDHEYFLSKFGDLVGVLRIQRKEGGDWKASLSKSNVPRVLSPEAVEQGLMPPPGHSGLPKSLEKVVPPEYHYWKAQGDAARQMRDALVEQSFFSDDCIKAVDGELRKVEVKYYLFDPSAAVETGKRFVAPTLSSRVAKVVPDDLMDKGFTPMSESEDWLEYLDKNDEAGALAILSPLDRAATSPRELVRAVKDLEAEYLLEHNDSRFARACFRSAGVVFKLHGEPSRVFCSSFAPTPDGVTFLKQGPVTSIEVQGLPILIDRPKGYVQTGKDADGNEWSREYQLDYGFLPRTKGGDGEELDVFLGPDLESKRVFWVTQNKADGTFDEYKLFIGFNSPSAARTAYTDHIPPQYYAGMSEVAIEQLKALAGVDPIELAKRLTVNAVEKINGVSLDEVRRAVSGALAESYPSEGGTGPCPVYVEDLYTDTAIYNHDGKTLSIGYTYANGVASFTGSPTPVTRTYVPAEGGAGAPPAAAPDAPPGATKRMKREESEISKRTIRVASIRKDEGEEHYVLGIVLEPDVRDAQDDIYSIDAVRKASERFMEVHRNMGLMHKQKVNDKVQILENYLAPCDMQIGDIDVKKGTWLMGVRVHDEALWKAVKSGDLTGFSIGGSAVRTPVDQEV